MRWRRRDRLCAYHGCKVKTSYHAPRVGDLCEIHYRDGSWRREWCQVEVQITPDDWPGVAFLTSCGEPAVITLSGERLCEDHFLEAGAEWAEMWHVMGLA